MGCTGCDLPRDVDGARLWARKYQLFTGLRYFSLKSMKIEAFSWCAQPDTSSHVSSLPEKRCLGGTGAVAQRIKPHHNAAVPRPPLSGGEESM